MKNHRYLIIGALSGAVTSILLTLGRLIDGYKRDFFSFCLLFAICAIIGTLVGFLFDLLLKNKKS